MSLVLTGRHAFGGFGIQKYFNKRLKYPEKTYFAVYVICLVPLLYGNAFEKREDAYFLSSLQKAKEWKVKRKARQDEDKPAKAVNLCLET
jgi:hypothetical protein